MIYLFFHYTSPDLDGQCWFELLGIVIEFIIYTHTYRIDYRSVLTVQGTQNIGYMPQLDKRSALSYDSRRLRDIPYHREISLPTLTAFQVSLR